MRTDGRKNEQLRKVKMTRDYLKFASGSCLIEMGDTKVVCSASVQNGVPSFLKGSGQGWLTAEYGMLPACSGDRIRREASKGKQSGRTQEIQRLIGRSVRAIIDLKALGERTIYLDADVIQADGGTRTASITGCYVALSDAIDGLLKSKEISENPLKDSLAAVSVGVVGTDVLLDLCYEEDSNAEVDMNVVMTGSEEFIEVQGTAEGQPYTDQALKSLVSIAKRGIRQLTKTQKKCLEK